MIQEYYAKHEQYLDLLREAEERRLLRQIKKSTWTAALRSPRTRTRKAAVLTKKSSKYIPAKEKIK